MKVTTTKTITIKVTKDEVEQLVVNASPKKFFGTTFSICWDEDGGITLTVVPK